MTHELTQPSEGIILARNAELRKNPGAIKDLGQGMDGGSYGRQMATIPEIMYHKALRDGFDFYSKDKKHAAAEMQRFLATRDGQMCLIRDDTVKSATKYHQMGI